MRMQRKRSRGDNARRSLENRVCIYDAARLTESSNENISFSPVSVMNSINFLSRITYERCFFISKEKLLLAELGVNWFSVRFFTDDRGKTKILLLI